MAFDILDPCKLPEKKEDLIQYNHELQDLGKHYGMQKVNRFKGKVNAQDTVINTTALTAEWPLFKSIMFENHLSYRSKMDRDISRAHLENVQELIKKRKSYTPLKLWDDLKHNNNVKEIYSNCIYLLHLLLIFPNCIACMEHLFSRNKLVKTSLCSQLKQTTLDSLLGMATELPLNGFTNGNFDHFVDELMQLKPKHEVEDINIETENFVFT